jgi:hypothetical protein
MSCEMKPGRSANEGAPAPRGAATRWTVGLRPAGSPARNLPLLALIVGVLTNHRRDLSPRYQSERSQWDSTR